MRPTGWAGTASSSEPDVEATEGVKDHQGLVDDHQ